MMTITGLSEAANGVEHPTRCSASWRETFEATMTAGAFVLALFVGTIVLVSLSIELGYRAGHIKHQEATDKRDESVSVTATTILGLLAFILAFTFGIAAGRYDTRLQLVRDEANAIRTVWSRADFLPDSDRSEAKMLIRQYLTARIGAVQAGNPAELQHVLEQSQLIQRQLWSTAVRNGRADVHSHVMALYIESLNEMSALHASRVAVGLELRVPAAVWFFLASVTLLGMGAVGYQFGLADVKRSRAISLLSIAFGLVIALIGILDRPIPGLSVVPQHALIDLQSSIEAERNL
jgi:hypothetical protein